MILRSVTAVLFVSLVCSAPPLAAGGFCDRHQGTIPTSGRLEFRDGRWMLFISPNADRKATTSIVVAYRRNVPCIGGNVRKVLDLDRRRDRVNLDEDAVIFGAFCLRKDEPEPWSKLCIVDGCGLERLEGSDRSELLVPCWE